MIEVNEMEVDNYYFIDHGNGEEILIYAIASRIDVLMSCKRLYTSENWQGRFPNTPVKLYLYKSSKDRKIFLLNQSEVNIWSILE